jgi:hypothetical protein
VIAGSNVNGILSEFRARLLPFPSEGLSPKFGDITTHTTLNRFFVAINVLNHSFPNPFREHYFPSEYVNR